MSRDRRDSRDRDDSRDRRDRGRDDSRDRRDDRRRDDDDDDRRASGRDNTRERETIPIDKDDAAFVLGRNGSTKRKIARVCGAELDLNEEELVLEIYGTDSERQRARDYVKYVMQQRVGPVNIDLSGAPREDLTVVDVPEDCVGFVMGNRGATLRSMEDEWGTLMFFAQVREQSADEQEKLCIFGTVRSRRGAELKVMSAVEHKKPGSFVRGENLIESPRVPGDDAGDDWRIDTMPLSDDNFSYALGSKGSTRRKLATASDCIIEYVGRLACFAGYRRERRRGKDYMKWLLAQRTGTVSVDIEGRDDVTTVEVPSESVGFITGFRGETLRRVEAASGTFCFTDGSKHDKKEYERVLIFSAEPLNRKKAKRIIEDKVDEHKDLRSRGPPRGGYGGGGYGGGGYGRYDDRDRRGYDRYDDRDRRGYDRYDDRDRRGYDRYDDRDRRGGYDRYDDHRDRRDRRSRSRSRDRRY